MLLIAAGGFAVIYGEGHSWRTRWRVMGTAGLLLVGGSVAGALVGSVVWAQDSHWWLLLAALFTAGAAGLGAFVHNALRLPPPGSFSSSWSPAAPPWSPASASTRWRSAR